MTRLSVNLNKVALLRNQRDIGYPDVLDAARVVLEAGAGGITVHPRPDERHIRRTDVHDLAAFLATRPGFEFNVEGFPTDDFLALVTDVACEQVTLVPDAPDQRTSDHGWNARLHEPALHAAITRLKAAGRRVILFADPEPDVAKAVHDLGADGIELYTGPYAFGVDAGQDGGLHAYTQTAARARDLGLTVNAGHDLNLINLPGFLGAMPWCAEVSIGHAITADALMMGWREAVRRYLALCRGSAPTLV